MQGWVIYNKNTGAAVQINFKTASAQVTPNASNFTGWDSSIHAAIQIDGYDEARQTWNTVTKVLEENAAKVEAQLIMQVKATNESLVRSIYSTNYGKQKKYSRKQQEVLDYRALGGTLNTALDAVLSTATFTVPLASMTVNQRKKKFRFAMAQANKRGVSLDVIIGEMEAAITSVEDQVADWEAIELESIKLIKAATTAAAKRAVYAAIDWNWRST